MLNIQLNTVVLKKKKTTSEVTTHLSSNLIC